MGRIFDGSGHAYQMNEGGAERVEKFKGRCGILQVAEEEGGRCVGKVA